MTGSGATPEPAKGLEYRWLLPASLLDESASRGGNQRSVRDWIVDASCFLLATGYGLFAAASLSGEPTIWPFLMIADQIVSSLGCAALWLRRRWPVGLALALIPLASFSLLVQGAVAIALFTVAVHRPFRTAAAIGVLVLATSPIYATLRPDPTMTFSAAVLLSSAAYAAVLGWGMLVRSRRQLLLFLHDRTLRAEQEATSRAEEAQRLERDRIAREIHDVLAHRLSLLSVYAGALEYRVNVSAEELARAVSVIRDSSHQALQDVREVIGVLRAPVGAADHATKNRPSPTFARLDQLFEESRQAGMVLTVDYRVDAPGAVPEAEGRAAYRIAQEALTNARKHAPGAAVRLSVWGSPDEGLTIEVRNTARPDADRPVVIPGTGRGLVGLRERATLAGGRLEHGRTDSGDFEIRAWLPWSA